MEVRTRIKEENQSKYEYILNNQDLLHSQKYFKNKKLKEVLSVEFNVLLWKIFLVVIFSIFIISFLTQFALWFIFPFLFFFAFYLILPIHDFFWIRSEKIEWAFKVLLFIALVFTFPFSLLFILLHYFYKILYVYISPFLEAYYYKKYTIISLTVNPTKYEKKWKHIFLS